MISSVLYVINRKIENSTPCKIVTHEDFNFKLGTRDYVVDITHHTMFGSNRSSAASPQIEEIIHFCDYFVILYYFSRSRAQIEPSHHSYAEWLKRRVSIQGRSFWGSGRWVTSYGEICPKNSPKGARIGSFKPKKPKSLHRNISGTINPTN